MRKETPIFCKRIGFIVGFKILLKVAARQTHKQCTYSTMPTSLPALLYSLAQREREREKRERERERGERERE
jgi:hypothetical protein